MKIDVPIGVVQDQAVDGKDLTQGFILAERFGLNNHPRTGRNTT